MDKEPAAPATFLDKERDIIIRDPAMSAPPDDLIRTSLFKSTSHVK